MNFLSKKNSLTISEGPLVSIITVCLNAELTISETIKSVLRQKYHNIEYIIIDGGSSDETLNIVKNLSCNFIKIISEKDDGIYQAMNKGIDISRGELIGIINADDFYTPDAISNVVNNWLNLAKPDVIVGMTDILNKFHQSSGFYSGAVLPPRSNKIYIPHPSAFVSRSCYLKYGKFDERFRYAADKQFFLRLYFAGARFICLDEIYASFRQNGFGSTAGWSGCIENFFIDKTYYGLIIAIKNFFINLTMAEYFKAKKLLLTLSGYFKISID